MTRVSSAQIPAASLADISKAQQQLIEAARQSSAQTKADDLKGYGSEAQTLVSAERLVSRTNGFLSTARELDTRMQIQDVALGRAADSVSTLKDSLFQNVSLDSGKGIRAQLEEAFSTLKDAMNSNLGGRYLFGGTVNDQPPVKADSLDDLANNPLSDSLVQGADAQVMRVEDGSTVQAGVVADDVVTDAMASLKRLVEYDNGPNGPFSDPLTDDQSKMLTDELGSLSKAFDGILSQQAENGRLQKQVDDANGRQKSQLDALNGAIGGITNVDLAEVAVKLNQAQYAYQASAGVFNVLRNMSLIDMLK